jgi:16S rRNA (guanine(966)-N(2))-methyltransferase RsmD
MRVIAGSHKGRRLLQPPDRSVRPTSDRVKEALFSILGSRILDAHFIDLYAGTGAIGIEALSRGAARVSFVESHRASLRLLRANLAQLRVISGAEVYACSAERFLRQHKQRGEPLPIMFADPPYAHTEALLPSLDRSAIITPDTIVVLEHATKTVLPARVGQLSLRRQYRYGDTTLSVFVMASEGFPAE